MKKIFFTLSLFGVAFLLWGGRAHAQAAHAPALLRHIVIITFKQGAPPDSIKALDDIYTALSKSPVVKDFEMGVNISPRDTTAVKHVYVTSFVSKEDMQQYRKIPEYARLFKVSLAIADDVNVVDYWINK